MTFIEFYVKYCQLIHFVSFFVERGLMPSKLFSWLYKQLNNLIKWRAFIESTTFVKSWPRQWINNNSLTQGPKCASLHWKALPKKAKGTLALSRQIVQLLYSYSSKNEGAARNWNEVQSSWTVLEPRFDIIIQKGLNPPSQFSSKNLVIKRIQTITELSKTS